MKSKRPRLKKNLVENANFCGVPFGKFLDQIIRGMIGDAMNSEEKILREQQRIEKIRKGISVIVSIINDGENERISFTTKQFYDDLLTHNINSVFNKIKK